jgi:hypothetical protein
MWTRGIATFLKTHTITKENAHLHWEQNDLLIVLSDHWPRSNLKNENNDAQKKRNTRKYVPVESATRPAAQPATQSTVELAELAQN